MGNDIVIDVATLQSRYSKWACPTGPATSAGASARGGTSSNLTRHRLAHGHRARRLSRWRSALPIGTPPRELPRPDTPRALQRSQPIVGPLARSQRHGQSHSILHTPRRRSPRGLFRPRSPTSTLRPDSPRVCRS